MRRPIAALSVTALLLLSGATVQAQTIGGRGGHAAYHGPIMGVIRSRAVPHRVYTNNLIYHNGKVMHTNTVYAIYWDPSNVSINTATESPYESLITRFLGDVAQDSGTANNVYDSDTQYYDVSGRTKAFITYSTTYGGSVVDTTPLPAQQQCRDRGTTACVTDSQITAEIDTVRAHQTAWNASNAIYLVFTPKGLGSCFDSMSRDCAFTGYCAYHSDYVNSSGVDIVYANLPYVDTAPAACGGGQHPNGSDADDTISALSHEHNEAITDPFGTAWYDRTGNENGDKCAWNYGTPLGSTESGTYNQIIDGDHYSVQQEWSNLHSGCVQRGT